MAAPWATELVQIFSRAAHAKERTGAALFGPDLSKWHPRIVDAAVVIEQESIREHNARFEAEHKD